MENIELIYMGFKNDDKITMNKIFKNMIGNDNKKPIWTEKQTYIKKKKKDLTFNNFFSHIKTTSRIDDFRKFFISIYFISTHLTLLQIELRF